MEQARQILSRYREGICTAEEIELLHQWFETADPEDVKQLDEEEIIAFQEVFKERFYRTERRFKRRKRLAVASVAAIIVFLGTAVAMFFYRADIDQIAYREGQQDEILPGSNKATLTLAEGRQIVLNDQDLGTVMSDGGMLAVQREPGVLVYEADLRSIGGDGEPALGTQFNTIEAPAGGTYRIRLSDGSEVWVNNASKLRFPLHFVGSERRVELLEGEAYFSVKTARDEAGESKPFIVQTQGEEVEVLGTEFNISSYPGERRLTTLIKGAIQVGNLGESKRTVIHPGQQVYFENGVPKVTRIDPESVYAWKNGYFLFDDETLEDIMTKVGRWYDVSVDYQPGVDKEGKFWGSVSKFENVSVLLEKLELTGAVRFEIKGRRVSVMK